MSSKPEQLLKVGDWWYLPEQDKLVKIGIHGDITETAALDNLCHKALSYFILNAGRLVTRDEILADVWGVRDVSDGRISRVIRVIRVALGDDSREPRYIETIPKRGFRFIAPVSEVDGFTGVSPVDLAKNQPTVEPAASDDAATAALATTAATAATGAALSDSDLAGVDAIATTHDGAGTADGAATMTDSATDAVLQTVTTTHASALGAKPAMQKPALLLSRRQRHWLAAVLLGFVGLCYLGWQQLYPPVAAVEEVPFKRYIPLTSLKGRETNPAVSPDGRYLVYNYRNNLERMVELQLQDIQTREITVLAKAQDGSITGAAWRPDGKALAYVKTQSKVSCELRVLELNAELTAVQSDQVLSTCGIDRLSGRLDWSPDGKLIVYAVTPTHLTQMVLMLYPLNGGKPEQLTTPPSSSVGDFAARFSRDSQRLVFLRDVGGAAGQIWTMDLATRNAELLHELKHSYPSNIDWYDQDRKIIFPNSPNSLATIDIQSKEVQHFANTDDEGRDIVVSDQNEIYASIGELRKTNFIKINNPTVNAQTSYEVIFESSRSERLIQLPLIAGAPTALLSNKTGLYQVWFHYPDGRQVQISDFTEWVNVKDMQLSADGKQVLASVGNVIWLFAAEQPAKMLTQPDQVVRAPRWSADGRFVHFASSVQGRWHIAKVDIQTNQQQVVAEDIEYFHESPDGRYQVVRRSNDKNYELRLKESKEVLPIPIDYTGPLIVHFVLRDKALYYSLYNSKGILEIRRFDLASRTLHTTLNPNKLASRHFSVTLDEQYIYTTSITGGDLDIAKLPSS